MVVDGTLYGEKDSERFEKRAKLKVSSCVYVYCLAFLSSVSLASPMSESELVRQTNFGEVEGSWAIEEEQIGVFRGVPYAKPPIGSLRWRPPQPLENMPARLRATEFGRACYQPYSYNQFVWSRGEFRRGEDCLHLNIWGRLDSEKKPVMVWFHGGAHTGGYAHVPLFDGKEFARNGVVLVTVNYRLGVWGFLAHPTLSDESENDSSGNYGLLDKIASLKWVKENIASFGGDPENVTIFGQSAGSASVCALMTSPLAQGLFHKVIGQSASCLNAYDSDMTGEERGHQLMREAFGQKEPKSSDLRSIKNEDLLNLKGYAQWASSPKITVDGWVLPKPPLEVFEAREQSKVPVLLGSLANEGLFLFPQNENLSAEDFDDYLRTTFGDGADRVKLAYAAEFDESPGKAQHEIRTDLFMGFSMRKWAGYQSSVGQQSYLYFMDYVPPAFQMYLAESPALSLPGGPRSAGAYHSGELAYVFNSLSEFGEMWSKEDKIMAKRMNEYWSSFAKTGKPLAESGGVWDPYQSTTHNTMQFNLEGEQSTTVRLEKYDALASRDEI